jgi:GH15 family glucan-1,4-alpha-glucosidase
MTIPLPDQPSGGRSQFPPIGDYGFLSDCETTALVAPDGGIEWLCLPRMDSPSVFGAILDRDAGSFRINPADVEVPAARRYIPGTMVLETSWWTPGGWLVVTDALLMGPWHHDHERSGTHRRAPTDYEADRVLLRLIRCVNGQVQVRMDCNLCSTTAGTRRSGSTPARATTRRSPAPRAPSARCG